MVQIELVRDFFIVLTIVFVFLFVFKLVLRDCTRLLTIRLAIRIRIGLDYFRPIADSPNDNTRIRMIKVCLIVCRVKQVDVIFCISAHQINLEPERYLFR